MCDHNTSITEYDNGTVQVELCTWGCNRIIVLEKDKIAKSKATFEGIRDFYRGKYGKYSA